MPGPLITKAKTVEELQAEQQAQGQSKYDWLSSLLGRPVDPTSPLGVGRRVIPEGINYWKKQPTNFLDYLTQAPPEEPVQPPTPAGRPSLSQATTPTSPIAAPRTPKFGEPFTPGANINPAQRGEFDVPFSGGAGQSVRGRASFSGAPLNSEAALTGLKQASSQFSSPSLGDSLGVSGKPMHMGETEQLYRQAYADPDTIAPGANAWAQNRLSSVDPSFAQRLEMFKAQDNPQERVAQIQGQSGIEQQRIQSKGLLDVAREGGQARLEALQSLLAGGGGALNPGSTVSISGLGSVHSGALPRPNQQALDQLRIARELATANGTTDMLSGKLNQYGANLDQALVNVFAGFPVSQDAKDAVREIILDRDIQKLPTLDQQLQAIGLDISQLTDDERNEIRQLYGVAAGSLR